MFGFDFAVRTKWLRTFKAVSLLIQDYMVLTFIDDGTIFCGNLSPVKCFIPFYLINFCYLILLPPSLNNKAQCHRKPNNGSVRGWIIYSAKFREMYGNFLNTLSRAVCRSNLVHAVNVVDLAAVRGVYFEDDRNLEKLLLL